VVYFFKKKHYVALEYIAPKLDKFVITTSGLAIRKQDRPLIVRELGDKIVNALLFQKEGTIIPLIKETLERLVNRKFSLAEVSTSISIADEYAGDNYIQVTLAKLVEAYTGVPVTTGSRISYVIHEGHGKLYERGVPLEQADLARVDVVYLIANLLERSILVLLEFNPGILMQCRQIIAKAIRTASTNADGMQRLV